MHFPMANDAHYLFMYLLAISISSLDIVILKAILNLATYTNLGQHTFLHIEFHHHEIFV